MQSRSVTIGIVGARGYTAAELICLICAHPFLELCFVSSRQYEGQPIALHHARYSGDLVYENLSPSDVSRRGVDVIVLALPNGLATPFVAAIRRESAQTLIIDLSADHRFDAAWYYGLPELKRRGYTGQRQISNPGCYATAIQLALAPLVDLLAGPVQCFGVSGYSGAGTTPSEMNDPAALKENLIPYALTNHLHEREVTFQLATPIAFMPHVASFFRGIMMTVNGVLCTTVSCAMLKQLYVDYYGDEPLIHIVDRPPWVSQNVGLHIARIGGFSLSLQRRVVIVATLDNLLKGAATQAMQSLNLALGFDEWMSIPLPPVQAVPA